tara:strand:- start:418 stop:1746 length:1329 start_codon:yes stop_codon:yes gene_type:complete
MKSFNNFFVEARTKAGLDAQKKGLVHTGKGYYADGSGNIVAKAENGERLVRLSKADQDKLKVGQPLNVGPQSAQDAQNLKDFADKVKKAQKEREKLQPDQSTQQTQSKKDSGKESAPQRNKGGGSVVITFGRFNPPHVGHQKLMDKVSSEAYKDGSDYMIYPSQSQDSKKNPLDFKSKSDMIKTMFPHHSNNIADETGGRNIFDVLKGLHAKGYDNVKIVVGDDRVKEFDNITSKYNGKAYNFGNLNVVSAGARDADSEGVEGMSASKMRKAALENDFDSFKKGMPKDTKPENLKNIYKQVRKSMKLENAIWEVAPKLDFDNLREEYYQENIFNVGEIVESLTTGIIGEIIVRGSNYVIILDEEGRTFRTWLDNISLVEVVKDASVSRPDQSNFSADDGSGNTWKVGTDEYTNALLQMTPGQSTKKKTPLNSTKKTENDGHK